MLHAIAAFLRREGETLERAPAHEMLRVGLCLAFTGGFLDAYTYLLRGGVFANAQTGNMVLMALYAARRDGRAFYYLLPIAAFLAGVIVTEWLKARLTNAQHTLGSTWCCWRRQYWFLRWDSCRGACRTLW